MRRTLLLAAAAGMLVPAVPAAAQEYPAEVEGIKIAVPNARGRSAWGTKRLTKKLREEIELGTGVLVSNKAMSKAQRKLRIRGRARSSKKNLARAGREAGAQYVLIVDVTKKKWVYTAHAVLVNTATGEQQMDFRSGFYKPKSEATDRGGRIARTTLAKIAKLIQEGSGPAGAVAEAPTDDDALNERVPDDTAADPPATPDPPEDTVVDDDPVARADEPADDRIGDDPPETVADPPMTDKPMADPPMTDKPMADKPAMDARDEGSMTAEVSEPDDDDGPKLVYASVTAGSGLLHSYEISSDRVQSSGLSYRLSPVALFAANVEVVIPDTGVGIVARGGISPMRFSVDVDGESVATPKGTMLDVAGGVDLHLALGGSGEMAYELIPIAGLRLTTLSVDEHPANIVLSNSSITPFAGVGLKLPLTEILHVTLDFEGGLVVAYSEAPDETAPGGGSGIRLGGGLAARLWLTDALGLAFDAHFDLQNVSLDGTPSRQIPPDEDLSNPSISTRSLRTSLGIALRI